MVSFSSYCLLLVYPFIVNSFPYFSIPLFIAFQSFEFSSIVNNPTILYIIVPDEDKSYYQLITIIVGIIYKDLTKLANLPENKGTLPRKIEWILDEFANCPPLAELTIVLCIAMLVVFYKSTHYIANLLGRLIYC